MFLIGAWLKKCGNSLKEIYEVQTEIEMEKKFMFLINIWISRTSIKKPNPTLENKDIKVVDDFQDRSSKKRIIGSLEELINFLKNNEKIIRKNSGIYE